MAKAEIK